MAVVITQNLVIVSSVEPPLVIAGGIELTLQQVIYNALVGAGLSALVYDDVPQDAAFPYVVVGEDDFVDWSGDRFVGMQASVVVHVWARVPGRKEVKDLQAEVHTALHRANLTAVGYNFVTIDAVDSESFLDADGQTRHGVQTFSALIEEA